jgi:transcriptional regulator with XRE-family HTH domain
MYTKGITYRQLSKLSGVSIGELHNIAMQTSDPTQSTMIAIARGLNMEVTDVFNLKYK